MPYFQPNGPVWDQGAHIGAPSLLLSHANLVTEGWGFLVLDPNEVMGDVRNYSVPIINRWRYENIEGIGPGNTIHKQGAGFNSEWHFNITTDLVEPPPRLIVKAPASQVPKDLKYKTFFYNACDTGLHFIENFKHGNFVYTRNACNVDRGSASFVKSLVQGKTPAQATAILDDEEVDGRDNVITFGIKSTWN